MQCTRPDLARKRGTAATKQAPQAPAAASTKPRDTQPPWAAGVPRQVALLGAAKSCCPFTALLHYLAPSHKGPIATLSWSGQWGITSRLLLLLLLLLLSGTTCKPAALPT